MKTSRADATLGIVVALRDEARALTRTPPPLGRLYELRPGVLLYVCGIGAERAQAAARRLRAAGAAALLSWGTAGALDPALPRAAIVLPDAVLAPDGGAYPVDPAWRARLQARVHAAAPELVLRTGLLQASASVLADAAAKAACRQRHAALAVDMESAAVAEAAAEAGLPFMAVRSIVDTAAETLPPAALLALDEAGRLRPWALAGYLLRHPRELPQLQALGGHFQTARRALRRFAGAAGDFAWAEADAEAAILTTTGAGAARPPCCS